ncbi:MAG: ferric reductase-like transmembrane domain-containing protein [Candidatus Zambryskibacteria bacterium]
MSPMAKYLKNNLAYILLWVLVATPFVIWVFMLPLSNRFFSSGAIFRSLGQITGLLGMSLLSINFVLSARFKFLDRWFSGLNRVYIKHHLIGIIAFCLLLFHPTFLIIQYLLISLKASFDFILSIGNWPVTLGEVALLVFVILMVITLYLHFKYQNWKKTHQYMGAVLFLGGLHMLLVPSDISNNTLLKYYMLVLATAAIISYFYRTILGVYKKEEYKYKLQEVIRVNDSIVELKLIPLAEKMKFIPGQFVFIRFDPPVGEAGNGRIFSESHPFSITSFPNDGYLSLSIKTLGDYTSMVYLMKPGAICSVEGPFGAFSYLKAKSKRQIWMAGGIGITPFLSMARHIDESGAKDYEIDLYYSVKNKDELAFAEEFAEISRRNSNFKLHHHFSEKDGYISARSVVSNSGDISKAEIFLCGPMSFMQSLRDQFVKLGFDNNKIHSEEFNLSI